MNMAGDLGKELNWCYYADAPPRSEVDPRRRALARHAASDRRPVGHLLQAVQTR